MNNYYQSTLKISINGKTYLLDSELNWKNMFKKIKLNQITRQNQWKTLKILLIIEKRRINLCLLIDVKIFRKNNKIMKNLKKNNNKKWCNQLWKLWYPKKDQVASKVTKRKRKKIKNRFTGPTKFKKWKNNIKMLKYTRKKWYLKVYLMSWK